MCVCVCVHIDLYKIFLEVTKFLPVCKEKLFYFLSKSNLQELLGLSLKRF